MGTYVIAFTIIVGNCDGLLKGRRYFHCPANHGVFVRSSDVICVTGRKVHELYHLYYKILMFFSPLQPLSGGTAIPRIRERLPSGLEISRSTQRASKVSSLHAWWCDYLWCESTALIITAWWRLLASWQHQQATLQQLHPVSPCLKSEQLLNLKWPCWKIGRLCRSLIWCEECS